MKIDSTFLYAVCRILPDVKIPYFVLEETDYDNILEEGGYSWDTNKVVSFNGIRLIPRPEYNVEMKYKTRIEQLEERIKELENK